LSGRADWEQSPASDTDLANNALANRRMGPFPIRHIAILMAGLGSGGIGSMGAHLTRGPIAGSRGDLLLGKARGSYLGTVDAQGNLRVLGSSHELTILPKLARYLRREAPPVVICDRLRVNLAAQRGARLPGASPCILASVHGVRPHKVERSGGHPERPQKSNATPPVATRKTAPSSPSPEGSQKIRWRRSEWPRTGCMWSTIQ
jgi:hypothetical protein